MGKKVEKQHDILRTYSVDPSFRGKKTTPEKLSLTSKVKGSSIAKKVRQKEKRKAFITSITIIQFLLMRRIKTYK